jgi:COP9 signalosome complex subunit 1
MINDFYSSRYKNCLSNLEKLRVFPSPPLPSFLSLPLVLIFCFQPDLELDLHLHDHIEPLYTRIRNKALIQYFSPFISVDLNAMAAAFTTTVTGLEKELARLIMDGSISARIDSHNKV